VSECFENFECAYNTVKLSCTKLRSVIVWFPGEQCVQYLGMKELIILINCYIYNTHCRVTELI